MVMAFDGDTCRWCRKLLRFSNRIRLYCSDRCRRALYDKKAHDKFASEYGIPKESIKSEATPCYYCGLPAESIDHVRAQSLRGVKGAIPDELLPPDVHLPSCRECNSAIGTKYFRTISERKAFVKTWLTRRYRKYLFVPKWSDLELARLEGRLRQQIEAMQAAAETIRQRLRW